MLLFSALLNNPEQARHLQVRVFLIRIESQILCCSCQLLWEGKGEGGVGNGVDSDDDVTT